MPPALPVVRVTAPGRKIGKTLLASRLIDALTDAGYLVASIKRSHHPVPPDREGSDTDRFARAGAEPVIYCGPDGVLERWPAGPRSLEEVVRRLGGIADLVIVEGFKDDTLGAVVRLDPGPPAVARFESMDGRPILECAPDAVDEIVAAIEREFLLSADGDPELREMTRRSSALHGHFCPGIVLGVRMARSALRALGVPYPVPPHRLAVTVEIGRCATDAIQAVTGCSPGRRDLRVIDYGKMAATFLDRESGRAMRVIARDDARDLAAVWAEGVDDEHDQQAAAYRRMPDDLLLQLQPVELDWEDGAGRPRVTCSRCGESVSLGRFEPAPGGPLCIACASGVAYYRPAGTGTPPR